MTIFLCAKCSTELTGDLVALPAVPEVDVDPEREDGRAPSTVPRGHYAVEPEPWGAPYVTQHDDEDFQPCQPRGSCVLVTDGFLISAGTRNNVIIHPDDAPLLQDSPDYKTLTGCHGPDGRHRRNQVCPCGAAVATLTADCTGPHELHLDPIRTYPLDEVQPR
ncbi:hypothetical protein [Actinoplanes sp. NPDC049802]|uniref:hypothetical protein n=1 Tax=Actinoplanes sp. NPDC049802 TaxID=3154742 RepID=UPI0033DEC7C7